jgi:proteic killer suppression protein
MVGGFHECHLFSFVEQKVLLVAARFKGSVYRVKQDHVKRLARILAALDAANRPEQLDAPGWGLHKLKGELNGFYAVKVSGNWRVIFRFEESDVLDVDYLDYH